MTNVYFCSQNFDHILSDRAVAYLNVDIAVQGSSVNRLIAKHLTCFCYQTLGVSRVVSINQNLFSEQ